MEKDKEKDADAREKDDQTYWIDVYGRKMCARCRRESAFAYLYCPYCGRKVNK